MTAMRSGRGWTVGGLVTATLWLGLLLFLCGLDALERRELEAYEGRNVAGPLFLANGRAPASASAPFAEMLLDVSGSCSISELPFVSERGCPVEVVRWRHVMVVLSELGRRAEPIPPPDRYPPMLRDEEERVNGLEMSAGFDEGVGQRRL